MSEYPVVVAAPSRYVQQPGLLEDLGRWCRPFCPGGGVLVIAAPHIMPRAAALKAGFAREGMKMELVEFGGECCNTEISRLRGAMLRACCTMVVGIGGGKVLDTAKAVAHFQQVPVAVAPTAASSDAPCSALAVLYTDDGRLDRYLPLAQNPQLVLADSEVIAAAPPRLLAAGLGDALATWYEARACARSRAVCSSGGVAGAAALAMARGCRDILFAMGETALADAKAGRRTGAVEQVIEVNLYLSGVGFENGGLAAAHAVNNAFSGVGLCPGVMHGELVAFGLLVQLTLEQDDEEFANVLRFCRMAGLPCTLADIGCGQLGPEMLELVAEKACDPSGPMKNMPFAVTPAALCEAIRTASARAQGE